MNECRRMARRLGGEQAQLHAPRQVGLGATAWHAYARCHFNVYMPHIAPLTPASREH